MEEQSRVDRTTVRAMVEDHWRSFLAVARQNPLIALKSINGFRDRLLATASLMPPEQAQEFLQAVDEEDQIIAEVELARFGGRFAA